MTTPATRHFITVVSGLPRSGTSLMMQMITAGGIPPLTDALRTADDDNPRGYFELEKVKQLRQDRSWLPEARGKVVKIIHLLLTELPTDQDYRVVFMQRDLAEVTKSQAVMLQRSGKSGADLAAEKLAAVYASQLTAVKRWMSERPCFKVLDVNYTDTVQRPRLKAIDIDLFLGGGLNVDAMAGSVAPELYRNRASTEPA